MPQPQEQPQAPPRAQPIIEAAMRRALELAARGPATDANPQVGCVILSPSGETLAEGWHRGRGTPHAETDALSHLAEGAARGATAVVTLEPCNHHGRTPPCSVALIEAGIARVVFAVTDPNPAAKGGAARLLDAGVSVLSGVVEPEVTELLRPWLTAMRLGRPHVTLKWASSLDGRAAAADGSSQWITGPQARAHVHEQRAAADAIIVGTGTVLADNPSLTARDAQGALFPHQPLPVIIGERAVPAGSRLCDHPVPFLAMGTRDLQSVMRDLFDRGIRRVFVEGGPTLASAFVTAGLVDEYLIYLAPILLGGDRLALGDLGIGTLSHATQLQIRRVERCGHDIVVTARPHTTVAPADKPPAKEGV
ncbi:MAG: bifunctional diaminohydroxyphosphoribosylaminopyrimidine deaminase/5-amino-6-(5-phosphoribosylamino)uracil reductase RibD [Terrimesophilobacter sp.]